MKDYGTIPEKLKQYEEYLAVTLDNMFTRCDRQLKRYEMISII